MRVKNGQLKLFESSITTKVAPSGRHPDMTTPVFQIARLIVHPVGARSHTRSRRHVGGAACSQANQPGRLWPWVPDLLVAALMRDDHEGLCCSDPEFADIRRPFWSQDIFDAAQAQ